MHRKGCSRRLYSSWAKRPAMQSAAGSDEVFPDLRQDMQALHSSQEAIHSIARVLLLSSSVAMLMATAPIETAEIVKNPRALVLLLHHISTCATADKAGLRNRASAEPTIGLKQSNCEQKNTVNNGSEETSNLSGS